MITASQHLFGYKLMVNEVLSTINLVALERCYYLFKTALMEHRAVYVCGNGGSAAIAQHFSCDHTKGVYTDCKIPNHNVISLSTNVPLITAIANDIGYDHVFSEQLNYVDDSGVLVVISSSGNSPNIIRALDKAKQKGMQTVAFTGFGGGQAASIADVSVVVHNDNYGVVEDVHQILMHILAQTLRMNFTSKPLTELKL